MLHGSYVRGDSVLGRSDIDVVLVFPDNVVIDKKRFSSVAQVLAEAQEGNNIPFQVTPSDLRTMQDGRFNSFDPDFADYYRNQFTYSMAQVSNQNALRFNLRKSRQGLLFSAHDRQIDYSKFLERFNKTLDATSRASKQNLAMHDGKLRKNRFSALEVLSAEFPQVDVRPFVTIKILYNNPTGLDKLYKKPDELIEVWSSAVTFFEELVRAYLDRHPRN